MAEHTLDACSPKRAVQWHVNGIDMAKHTLDACSPKMAVQWHVNGVDMAEHTLDACSPKMTVQWRINGIDMVIPPMATAPMVMAGQGMCCGAVHRAASVVLTAWWGSLSCQCAIGVICDASLLSHLSKVVFKQIFTQIRSKMRPCSAGHTSCLVCLGVLTNMDNQWASPPAWFALGS
eukprot:1157607-Pelagomonas_calceolata.AAC.8